MILRRSAEFTAEADAILLVLSLPRHVRFCHRLLFFLGVLDPIDVLVDCESACGQLLQIEVLLLFKATAERRVFD